MQMARRAAQVTLENDLLYRSWAAKQGGIYLRVSAESPPNPYLQVPDRDVTTESGQRLTLINPAYMVRQVHASPGPSGSRSHLTSLKPLRPENAPDSWEAAALQSFEQGVPEMSSVQTTEEGEFLRLMRPLVTEPGCLNCHQAQGYKEGDIRGGMSISVPTAPLRIMQRSVATHLAAAHTGLWLVGLAGLGVFRRNLGREVAARERTDEQLRELNTALEDRVRAQTAALRDAAATLEQRVADRTAELREQIAERRRAEEALRRSERRYRSFVDVTSQFAWVTDPNGLVAEDIPALRRFTGQTIEQARGAGWAEALHPDDRQSTIEVWNRAVATRTPYETEYRMRRHDGVYRLLQARGVPILDAQNQIVEWVGTCIDVTERKEAEAALREGEQRLRLFIEHAPAALAMFDHQMRYVSVSRRWLSDYGLEGRDVHGLCHYEVLPDIPEHWREIHRRALRGEIIQAGEDLFLRADGSKQWLRREVRPWFDGAGQIAGIVVFSEDVTERKEAEEMLHRYESLARHTRDIILFVDCDTGQITEANAAALAAYGYSREDILRLTIYDLRAPETRGLTAAQMATANETGIRFETIHRRKDGTCFPVEASSQGATIGQSRMLLSVIRDITERKQADEALRQSELFYRQTLESIPGMVFTTRPDGYCDYQSQQWVEFTGVPMSEHLGDGWNKLLHPEDRLRAAVAWQAAVEERAAYDLEYRVRRYDGEYEWFKVIGRPIHNASGHIARWFGVAANIHRLKRVEEALIQAQEQLRYHAEDLEKTVASRTAKLHETIAELEHFSYAIVHDMRAPLRAMQGFSSMIEDECAQCPRTVPKEYFKRIKIASSRMDQLIADSLNYSQAARRELPMETVELFPLLDGMIKTYPNLQPEQAEIQIDPHLPLVLGNEAALTQCFSNLLGNAVKFGKPDVKPRVRVRAEPVTGSPFARIWVEDDGIGIPEEYQQRIFGMFQRVTNEREGTGIGLAIVRKVVERMGGKVGVESKAGAGSRFWVELRQAI